MNTDLNANHREIRPLAASLSMKDAQRALSLLASDLSVSGTRLRQRSLIARITTALGVVDFLIGYESEERRELEGGGA